jgi:hypothetical protein
MAFIQPCFIRKNTPELRKRLEELGYTNGAWESPHFEYPYLMCFPNRKFGLFKGKGFYMTEDDYRCDGKRWTYNPPKEYIDCGDNEDLFLSIAALRDDTDKWQLFVFDGIDVPDYFLQKGDMWICSLDKHLVKNCHKATVEEIIEHFKKE